MFESAKDEGEILFTECLILDIHEGDKIGSSKLQLRI